MEKTLLERFIRYVKIDTQSDESSSTYPSTEKQFDLAKLLVSELKELGLTDASVDNHCYVTATLPGNQAVELPKIGLIAHLDTSPDVSGKNVNPQIIENYQGGDIPLSEKNKMIIKECENSMLKKCIGHTIVTTDGTTLLGADDKAGIAAIMMAIQTMANNPDIPHGDILVAFTPDEEIGQGTKYFDVKKFGADYAYTVDGGMLGQLNNETFNANTAKITIHGRDIHPGTAKNIMVNSIRVASEIISFLPREMAPETTEGHEPFIHPHSIEATIAKSTIKLILRDFKVEGLDEQKQILDKIISDVQKLYPDAEINMEITESYRNMFSELENNQIVLDNLWEAAKISDAKPFWSPIRGGTDGARLTANGLPTPNIFMGGQNYHGPHEWLSLNTLEITVKTLINLAVIWSEESKAN